MGIGSTYIGTNKPNKIHFFFFVSNYRSNQIIIILTSVVAYAIDYDPMPVGSIPPKAKYPRISYIYLRMMMHIFFFLFTIFQRDSSLPRVNQRLARLSCKGVINIMYLPLRHHP